MITANHKSLMLACCSSLIEVSSNMLLSKRVRVCSPKTSATPVGKWGTTSAVVVGTARVIIHQKIIGTRIVAAMIATMCDSNHSMKRDPWLNDGQRKYTSSGVKVALSAKIRSTGRPGIALPRLTESAVADRIGASSNSLCNLMSPLSSRVSRVC